MYVCMYVCMYSTKPPQPRKTRPEVVEGSVRISAFVDGTASNDDVSAVRSALLVEACGAVN